MYKKRYALAFTALAGIGGTAYYQDAMIDEMPVETVTVDYVTTGNNITKYENGSMALGEGVDSCRPSVLNTCYFEAGGILYQAGGIGDIFAFNSRIEVGETYDISIDRNNRSMAYRISKP